MPPRPRAAVLPLVAVFAAGYLAAYLLPTLVGHLGSSPGGLGLSSARAGAVGSALLLSSAAAGLTLASRVARVGAVRLARTGLLLMVAGFALAAGTSLVPLVVAGCVIGGFGSGTATAVAAVGIAARPDPHRASVLGLLTTSATAGALYLVLPRLGGGHALPFAAIACAAALALPAAGRLPAADPADPRRLDAPTASRLPHRRSGAVLAGAMLCWSLAQNALWGVSGRIGLDRAGLSEAALGLVFAVALGGGLAGVGAAGALGSRLGRAVPIGVGTAVIATCVAVSASAGGAVPFATGEVLWNTVYPVVLSYLIGLAASLDGQGRWAVLAGSASNLGVACGPLAGTLLAGHAGYPAMGAVLGCVLLATAVPLTAVALHGGGRVLPPGTIRRRGGAAAAAVAGAAGAPAGAVPELGGTELVVTDIEVGPAPTPELSLLPPSAPQPSLREEPAAAQLTRV
ncbi:MFS transporter [Streptomyces sp. SPB162]|uniref:MFS transporter n=1 Tax=Streptomyces sp. SPB162 TaxID=2940560 RepID=UPI00240706C4|nr:MFS transporter [Streptomyces sp. SPB162]MDF9811389.1 putative MFS family arabinose efflux permease [Streptomyces sp. SPB162]